MTDFWEKQARELLTLVEKTGQLLRDTAAVIEEHGGDVADLRAIVQGHGKIGEGMSRAAVRSRKVFEEHS